MLSDNSELYKITTRYTSPNKSSRLVEHSIRLKRRTRLCLTDVVQAKPHVRYFEINSARKWKFTIKLKKELHSRSLFHRYNTTHTHTHTARLIE